MWKQIHRRRVFVFAKRWTLGKGRRHATKEVVRRVHRFASAQPRRFRVSKHAGVISTSKIRFNMSTPNMTNPSHGQRDLVAAAGSTTTAVSKERGALASLLDFFDKRHSIAPKGYNRWLVVPAVFMIQTSIGSVYAWSIFNEPLTLIYGVVAPAASDWALTSVVPIFSLCAVSLGVTTFALGSWTDRAGPRKVAAAAALSWGSGLALAAAGAEMHCLPLLYLGYGVFGGIGWGLGYISPVSALMKWFPDRKGLATGLSLCFFGGGAMVATPLNEFLLSTFARSPKCLGNANDLSLVTDAATGKRFAEVAGETYEVVEAIVSSTASDIAETAVYAVGTGDSGVAMTFATMGAIHTAMMLCGSMVVRLPHTVGDKIGSASNDVVRTLEGEKNEGKVDTVERSIGIVGLNASEAAKTPQFYLLWAAVFGNAVAGVSVISCAKTMMNECFSSSLPALVTTSVCASYVAALSGANMSGRLGWAFLSDWTGRKNMYFLFGALGVPTTLMIPTLTTMASEGGGALPFYMFVGGSVAVVSFYGGLFSVLPAYIDETFGSKDTSGIHGKLLTAWSASALVGPTMMSQLRERSYNYEVERLTALTDGDVFERTFGAPAEELQKLIEAKTISIDRLMQIVPPGTIDPTPNLYDSTLYAMGGIMTAAMLGNLAIRKVDFSKYTTTPQGNGGAE